ncbi:uncharacterized protein LOC127717650 isoform X2 [Mytilus californianus]|nr:uncharacterized protein LOC127717650 isoform X2 [Mytilus californianus]
MTSQQQENPIDLQLTTYKTPAVTGSETLVSIEEFKSIFAIPYKYRNKKEPWPHTVTLLYKYSSNANTKYEDIPENTWKRIDNDPMIRDYKGEHAESIMIKQLMEIQNHLKKQKDYNRGSYKGIHTIDVILSFSPCNKHPHCCSTKLCDFKASLENDIRSAVDSSNGTTVETADDLNKKMSNLNMEGKEKEVAEKMPNSNIEGKEKEGAKIEMNIQFSNFYLDNVSENREGLKNLRQKGIKLDVLTGDKWIYFYRAIGFELPEGREEREKDDEAKFKELI